ncbi:hypothetical protein FACS1894186_7310 [Alphaproteobacteria bacterium]|nr:hypothetical protein FACS1894186_7310 [Alphaproteobacteria bacterium]
MVISPYLSTAGTLILAALVASAPASAAGMWDAVPTRGFTSQFFDARMTAGHVQGVIDKAIAAHNWIYFARGRSRDGKEAARVVGQEDQGRKLLEKNRQCNIGLLKPYFSDPDKVWDKMAASALDMEKKMAVQTVKASKEWISGKSFTSVNLDSLRDATNKRWDIGRRILVSVYATPEKWGNPVALMPLWRDQKAVYDVYWAKKYAAIHKAVEAKAGAVGAASVPKDGPKLAKPEHKYYKKFRSAVEKAHDDYVRALPAKLEASLTAAPDMPPDPLPPLAEAFRTAQWYVGGKLSVFPAVPLPWQEYIRTSLAGFDPKGEMASVAELKQVKDAQGRTRQALAFDNEKVPSKNRLEEYLRLHALIEETEDGILSVRAGQHEADINAMTMLKGMGFPPPKDFSFQNKQQVDDVSADLKTLKNAYLRTAEKLIKGLSKNEAKSLKVKKQLQTIADLRRDKDALMPLSIVVKDGGTQTAKIRNAEADTLLLDRFDKHMGSIIARDDAKTLEDIGCPIK